MTFPSDIEKNSRECKALRLRSGKQLLGLTLVEEDKMEPETEKELEKKQKEVEKVIPRRMVFPETFPRSSHHFPFLRDFKRRSSMSNLSNSLISSRS